jgi:putative aldouronate transport system substrate-binding protein
VVPPFSTTSGVANQWFIAHNSIQPAKAMQVLNEMYINSELEDTFVNGLEGEHFIYDKANGVIDYPEGVDASNTTYSSVAWAWLNELITTPWASDGKNIWTETVAFNKSARNSLAKGFMWDNFNVLNEIAACNNVKAKYQMALECGMLDPDEALPKYLQELKDAGVDAIIAEKQKQLDAWLAK